MGHVECVWMTEIVIVPFGWYQETCSVLYRVLVSFKRPVMYLFKTYWLSILYIPGSLLGTRIKSVKEREKKIYVIIEFTLGMVGGDRPRTINIIKSKNIHSDNHYGKNSMKK